MGDPLPGRRPTRPERARMSIALMESDVLQRIASAVTPAVMVSACGLIALGLINQAQILAGRLREVAREYRGPSVTRPRRDNLRAQVAILGRRHRTVTWALFLDYGAILAFTITSLLFLAHGVFPVPRAVEALAFLVGVLLLCASSGFAIMAVHLNGGALRLEQQDVLSADEEE